MTDRTPEDPGALADPTRDIALPPLADRPAPALPKEWAALRAPSVDAPTTAVPGPPRPPAGPAEAERRLAKARTDELQPQPGAPARERTLAFSSPEMRHRPIDPVQVGSNPRRWPWVVLTLLPILVIVGFGVAWLILLRGV